MCGPRGAGIHRSARNRGARGKNRRRIGFVVCGSALPGGALLLCAARRNETAVFGDTDAKFGGKRGTGRAGGIGGGERHAVVEQRISRRGRSEFGGRANRKQSGLWSRRFQECGGQGVAGGPNQCAGQRVSAECVSSRRRSAIAGRTNWRES